jgi:hypothetical protein
MQTKLGSLMGRGASRNQQDYLTVPPGLIPDTETAKNSEETGIVTTK